MAVMTFPGTGRRDGAQSPWNAIFEDLDYALITPITGETIPSRFASRRSRFDQQSRRPAVLLHELLKETQMTTGSKNRARSGAGVDAARLAFIQKEPEERAGDPEKGGSKAESGDVERNGDGGREGEESENRARRGAVLGREEKNMT